MRCPINSGQDAACGSFLCSLVFSVGVRSLFLNWSNLKLLPKDKCKHAWLHLYVSILHSFYLRYLVVLSEKLFFFPVGV